MGSISKIQLFSILIPVIALLVLPLKVAGQEQETKQPTLVLTLDKALSMALEQNRGHPYRRTGPRKSRCSGCRGRRSGALPQISLSGGYSWAIQKSVMFIPANTPLLNPTNSTQTLVIRSDHAFQSGITLYQPLFDRKIGVALDIANTYEDFSDEGFQATRQDVVLQVKEAFYGVMLAQKTCGGELAKDWMWSNRTMIMSGLNITMELRQNTIFSTRKLKWQTRNRFLSPLKIIWRLQRLH